VRLQGLRPTSNGMVMGACVQEGGKPLEPEIQISPRPPRPSTAKHSSDFSTATRSGWASRRRRQAGGSTPRGLRRCASATRPVGPGVNAISGCATSTQAPPLVAVTLQGVLARTSGDGAPSSGKPGRRRRTGGMVRRQCSTTQEGPPEHAVLLALGSEACNEPVRSPPGGPKAGWRDGEI
jgi:hypothetical protein